MSAITFNTPISSNLPKFEAHPNCVYRAAMLHYVDENRQLQPIVRGKRAHYHQVPEGQTGLGGFICLSTEDSLAPCCKAPTLFGDPTFRLAIPIILYPCDFQGNIIQNAQPDIQILMIYEKSWNKLKQINGTYPLSSNDITITGKKQGRGVALDFMPAGPAYWQQDATMYASLLNKAKILMEGPGIVGVDRILGRSVTLADIENAIRVSQGLPPAIPMSPNPGFSPMPMMGGVLPQAAPAAAAPPVPPVSVSAVPGVPPVSMSAVPPVPPIPGVSTPVVPPVPEVSPASMGAAIPNVPEAAPVQQPVTPGPVSSDQLAALASTLSV